MPDGRHNFSRMGDWKGRRLRPCSSCRGPTRYATEDEIAGYASAVLKILELGDSLYRAGTRLEEAAVPPGYAM